MTDNPSPTALDNNAKSAIADQADTIVASLQTYYHQLHKHHWEVTGPQHHDLHLFFEDAYETVHEHYDELAERIVMLDATPTSDPGSVTDNGTVSFHRDTSPSVRDMVRADLAVGEQLVNDLRSLISTADDHADYTTEDMARDALRSIELINDDLHDYLEPDTLTA